METKETAQELLDLMILPGFTVKNKKILNVNDAARRLFITPGMEVLPLLTTGQEEYEAFESGCLYLTIQLAGESQGVTVTRMEDMDVFLADEQNELRELQVLSLAAQELRMPLSNVILSADQLSSLQETQEGKDSAARLNRGAAQLQRLICNMSDALRYAKGGKLQTRNLTALVTEITEKAALLSEAAGLTLRFQKPKEDIFTLLDAEQLERALYNLISNSLKFTPKGGTIDVKLTRSGKRILLTVQDTGSGIGDGILKSIFSRYLRTPSLEDSRFGLGLGLIMVRAAAATHGGTVLIDRLEQGTKVTMTLALRENPGNMLRSPLLTVDYAGERDHGLLELSDALPYVLYLPEEK